ncbi:uncharacterized protein N7479_011402 [Penicillium vulpinum]|uniref:Uncharacterized protein n=1 Tax=Penicillium vulpinum TaxID=29845 RepID=A0A1V6RXS9_9EURO|nr:uncharacterized protein N7479_011402 [Penicillium vulpinum]KAJ5952989.1 hypothetical protein N7479_011402 [Penicillium vulpinum]OQE06388.1 hypothetical protein PENVUL_c018G03229 [Penicillium vulpinum]
MSPLYSTAFVDINPIQTEPPASDEENITCYPRHSANVVESLNILRQKLPSELVLGILEFAEYWVSSVISREESVGYSPRDCHDPTPYLTSEPIQGEGFPVRKIRINIWSCDVGWSSHSEDHGTTRNSWTWFDLGIERPPGRDDICEGENLHLMTNLLAAREITHHRIMYHRNQNLRWMQNLQPGDRISIVPMARFRGSRNTVKKASIEVYTSPLL